MSLVNDMLRDLDSRRREVPGGEIGGERLIPATDFTVDNGRGFQFRKIVLPMLLVILVLAVAALFMFGVDLPGRQPVAQPMAVITSPAVQPSAQTDVPERDSTLDTAMIDEISRMSERVRELEAKTLSLLEEWEPGQGAAAQEIAATASVPEWEPRAWDREALAEAPTLIPSARAETAAMPGQLHLPAEAQTFESSGPVASTVVRNASEMTFRDTDRRQVQQALELWQGNQRNEALQVLRQFSTQNIEAHQSREMLAKLLMQQGDTLAAMEEADLGLGIAPDHGGYKKIKARLMMTAGVPRDAAELLQVRPPSVASDTEYHELLAAAKLAGQLYDEAVRTYRALTTRDAQQSRWWYGLGAAMDATGKSFEAAQAYERAVQLGGLSSNLMQQSQQRIVAIRQN